MPEIQLDAEVSFLPPTEVKLEFASAIVEKRQGNPFVAGDGEIPAAIRVGWRFRIAAAARGFLMGDADHVEGEIVEGISQMPPCPAKLVVRPIPIRRVRVVGILDPPDRVDFVIPVNPGPVGAGNNSDAMPFGAGVGTFHGLPSRLRIRTGFR